MKNFSKYLFLFCLFVFMGLILQHQLKKNEQEKPVIYIDNYSGDKIHIFRNNQLWIKLDNDTSLINKDLNRGTHVLYAHNIESKTIDTIRINLKKENNYVLNLFGGMSYYEGELLYLLEPNKGNGQVRNEREITKSFFRTRADFLFEQPPFRIEEKSIIKMPSSKRKYLRRKNQTWKY